jgi:cytochrome c biogenesis protein CcmG/thiol:disulfide interchange protein DsbE
MTVRDMPVAPAAERGAQPPGAGPKRHSRWLLFGPAALFLGVVLSVVAGLGRDPNILPSPLIGQPVPEFSLPPVEGRRLGMMGKHHPAPNPPARDTD